MFVAVGLRGWLAELTIRDIVEIIKVSEKPLKQILLNSPLEKKAFQKVEKRR